LEKYLRLAAWHNSNSSMYCIWTGNNASHAL